MATKPFYKVADTILGSQFLEDIAEFFLLFQTMYDGFVERARAVSRTLEDKRTTFLVVTTLESAPVREAEFFIDALTERSFHLGGVVFNKVLPDYLLDPTGAEVARVLTDEPGRIAAEVAHADLPVDHLERVLEEVGASFLNFRVVATREAEERTSLSSAPEVVASVPYFERDIADLGGLLELGDQIWR